MIVVSNFTGWLNTPVRFLSLGRYIPMSGIPPELLILHLLLSADVNLRNLLKGFLIKAVFGDIGDMTEIWSVIIEDQDFS